MRRMRISAAEAEVGWRNSEHIYLTQKR